MLVCHSLNNPKGSLDFLFLIQNLKQLLQPFLDIVQMIQLISVLRLFSFYYVCTELINNSSPSLYNWHCYTLALLHNPKLPDPPAALLALSVCLAGELHPINSYHSVWLNPSSSSGCNNTE